MLIYLKGVEYLLLDSNAPDGAVTEAAKNGVQAGGSVCFEPTSVPKAKLLSESSDFIECLSYIFPNEDELFAMAEVSDYELTEARHESIVQDTHIRDAASTLLARMKPKKAHIVITLGSRGVLLASKEDASFTHFPAAKRRIKSSNRAGDTLCGAFLHALLQGENEEKAVMFGMKTALLSLDCVEHAISPDISTLAKK